MTGYTRSLLIVTTAALAPQYNAIGESMGFGPETFAHALYPAGGPYTTPTHYVCRSLWQEAVYEQLRAAYAGDIAAGNTYVYDFNVTTLADALTALGLLDAPVEGL